MTNRLTPASKSLQIKAGRGEISKPAIESAEEALENTTEDFQSIADGFLNRLKEGIENAQHGMGLKKELIAGMVNPVMEMKANARMLKYNLVTSLANIMMDFLETIDHIDPPALEIVTAHHRTLTLIINKRMAGDGGQVGIALQKELLGAIKRYYAQHKSLAH